MKGTRDGNGNRRNQSRKEEERQGEKKEGENDRNSKQLGEGYKLPSKRDNANKGGGIRRRKNGGEAG